VAFAPPHALATILSKRARAFVMEAVAPGSDSQLVPAGS
jgi:hypothetical protein